MKRNVLTAAALTLCLLTGCGGGDNSEAAALDANDLYGTWVQKFDGGSETLTLRSDGTYHKAVDTSGALAGATADDDWSLEGSDVTLYVSELNVGYTYSVSLSEDKTIMVWDNGDNRIVYKKK